MTSTAAPVMNMTSVTAGRSAIIVAATTIGTMAPTSMSRVIQKRNDADTIYQKQ